MKSTKICVFPDTLPQDDILFPLVQVFEQVVYLRPVENDLPDEQNASPMLQEAITEGLVDFCCPAPLGDDRKRFLRLVDDLQNRPDDYAGQLSNLSLAGLGRRGDQESKTTIINTLLKQNGIKDKQDEQRETVLWQARLVLALGEIFDRDQAALQKNLAQLAAKQQGLLDELREDDQQPFSFTKKLTGSITQTEKQLRLRLKAWSRLFALGSKEVDISIFVTTNSDVLDLLVDHYEVSQQKTPTKLIEILLPMACTTALSLKQRLDSIQYKKAKIFLESGILKKLASASQQERDQYTKEWTEILQHSFSPKEYKFCKIALYAFHDTSPQKIFLETFGRDEDGVQLAPSPSLHGTSDTIVGILS